MADRDEQILNVLRKYLPHNFEHFVLKLLNAYPVNFKIVAPRTTKLGDFRVPSPGKKPQITINNNLNPFSFLITTVHEFAHLIAFKHHGNRIKPHGDEWKLIYSNLIYEMLQFESLPKDIEDALMKSLVSVKASSCTDLGVARTLRKYDVVKNEGVSIETLSENAIFAFRSRKYRLINKRRTRYLCEDIQSKKRYLFHALTIIETDDK